MGGPPERYRRAPTTGRRSTEQSGCAREGMCHDVSSLGLCFLAPRAKKHSGLEGNSA